MIRLHPVPEANHICPYCQIPLELKGWYIPGMRNLANLLCSCCGREFYGDLAAGHGLYFPMLLEQDTGKVHDPRGIAWFADWLAQSYVQRSNKQIPLTREERKPVKRGVLLNCLDTVYGHSVLKLLNAQYYLDHRPDLDLILLVPRFLRWMVPDGVAAIWTIDLPLRRGTEWNDWLAAELHNYISAMDECWLSIAFSHPHPQDFEIERFTRVIPFSIDRWEEQLKQHPTVTFIWREDRLWNLKPGLQERFKAELGRFGIRLSNQKHALEVQRRLVLAVAETIRMEFSSLDFAVVGVGNECHFPDWIVDLRRIAPDDSMERAWCERYARSHVVIGVHGSNMLLPSAHAAAVVELIPSDRWGNIVQDLLVRLDDQRETMFRYRLFPLNTLARDVALSVISLMKHHDPMLANMRRKFCDHDRVRDNTSPPMARQQHPSKLSTDTCKSSPLPTEEGKP